MTGRRPALQVVVTGASRGLGLVLASKLSARGHRVIGVARSTPRERSRRRACADWLEVDLRSLSEVEAAAARIKNATPEGLDCLVNNAGIGYHCRAEAIQLQELQDVFGVNATAPILLTSRLLASLEPRQGLVVNVTSYLVDTEMPFTAVYTASKRALHGFGRVLQAERGLRVCSVEPGAMETDFLDATHDPPVAAHFRRRELTRLDPAAVADRILSVIEGPQNILVERLQMLPSGQRSGR